jgi:hypothetical protein
MSGHIVSGLGAAANLLHLQKPLLRGFLPDIENCKIGTINVQLDHALDIKIPDIVTPPLQWGPNSNVGEPMRRRPMRLRLIANQSHLPRIPRFSRGAFRDRHGRWARGAMDAGSARDECAVKRTAKSCGPDFSTLKSTWR